jgi:UTP:GlnB (protein PII) uridylyltransferase
LARARDRLLDALQAFVARDLELRSRCRSDVARKTWMRGARRLCERVAAALSMSALVARAERAHDRARHRRATAATDSNSCGD